MCWNWTQRGVHHDVEVSAVDYPPGWKRCQQEERSILNIAQVVIRDHFAQLERIDLLGSIEVYSAWANRLEK